MIICCDDVEKFKIDNDSILSFIFEYVVPRPNGRIIDNCSCKRMYDVYKEWCKDNNSYTEGKQVFNNTFIKYFRYFDLKSAIIKRETSYFKDYALLRECKINYQKIYGHDSIR